MYTTMMELGPKRPSPFWFLGPNSTMVVYMGPLGELRRPPPPKARPQQNPSCSSPPAVTCTTGTGTGNAYYRGLD